MFHISNCFAVPIDGGRRLPHHRECEPVMIRPARLGKPTVRCAHHDQRCLAIDWTDDGRVIAYNTTDPDGPAMVFENIDFGCWLRRVKMARSVFDPELFETAQVGDRWLVRIIGSGDAPVSLNDGEIEDFLTGVLDGDFDQYAAPFAARLSA